MAEPEPNKPWSTKQLAEAAGVTDAYIRRLLIDGRLDGYKLGREWLIPEEEAQRFIAERKARWQ